jgi:hypothetical protein
VAELPKREQSKLKTLWSRMGEMTALVQKHGDLVPQSFAAHLLGISRQRVDQLALDGRLVRVECHDQRFITANSLVELARTERKTGRPFKMPQGPVECWKASAAAVRDMRGKN